MTKATTPKEDRHVLWFHRKTMQPGCVLLQAALGGDTSFLTKHVLSEYWTLDPTDLVSLTVRERDLERFKENLAQRHADGWPE